jgi:hypothetical protein
MSYFVLTSRFAKWNSLFTVKRIGSKWAPSAALKHPFHLLLAAKLVLDALQKRWPWVKHLFGDAAYDRRTLMDKSASQSSRGAGLSSAPLVGSCAGAVGFATTNSAPTSPTTWSTSR